MEDPTWWDVAREIMVDELHTTLEPLRPPRTTSVAETIRWRHFMEATRRVYFHAAGVRVRPAGRRLADGLTVECAVTITNRKRTPLHGTLRFDGLPVGWRDASATPVMTRVAPGESRRLVLVVDAPSLTWNEAGIREIPLVFVADDGSTTRLAARMCHVAAQRIDPPAIDGHLRDWPTGFGNHAADFTLIGGADQAAEGGEPNQPIHDTLCFVGIADEKLHFAVRCEFDPRRRAELGVGGPIAPEDLTPLGADCVEILLDPSNAGTRSPADLYRIVLRAGGAQWEKGVAMDPPVAPPGQWAVMLEHAVQVSDGYWTAEAAVPLSAFPEMYRRDAVWGLNVTRFDQGQREYANWAGAVGNAYDPQSLGNMTVP
jgi:hypothetical protein